MAKPRAENRAGGRRAFPNTPHAPRMRPVYSVASGDLTNSRTEDSRRARLRADPFGVSSRTRLRCLPLCFAGISTHLDGDLAVALEPLELKGSLLDDFMLDEGSDLLRGGRDARRQRDGDGARRGFQILGLEPRTRGGAHRRRQTNATASPPNGDEGSRTRPMRDGRQDRSWGVTHHVVPFPCASKEGEAVRATDAQILISPSLLFGLPISIPYPDSFAYKIASEIRKYGNIPHIITYYYVCHSVVFSRFKPPFDSEHD
jgi:hypothetical protein